MGTPEDFLDGELPTKGQVLRCYQFDLNEIWSKTKKEPSRTAVMQLVTRKLISTWSQTYPNSQLLSERQITRIFDNCLNDYGGILKSYRRSPRPKNYEDKLKVCKCKNAKCVCKPYTPRRIIKDISLTMETEGPSMDFDAGNTKDPADADPTYKVPENTKVDQNRLDLYHFATVCDRFNISDRAAAALASALLLDVGLIQEHDTANIIDRSKVRRERDKVRQTLLERNKITEPESLYFDGRKDITLKFEKTELGRWRRKKIKEEHIAIIAEPGSRFLGHSTPTTGHALSISNSLLSHFESKGISLEKISSIGCDGTSVNTGHKGGVIRLLEPLQWFVCLLHFNELLLKHMMESVDGPTNGPRAYKGPIGQLLPTCHLLPVVDFSAIYVELPPPDVPDLSSDQAYLLQMAHSVAKGTVPPNVADLQPGPLNHARWLTLACRIMRLYVATEAPSGSLVTLATFVMQVYVPQWFDIKRRPSCTDGARHIFKAIERSRYLPAPYICIVNKVIQTNAFFAHQENVVLAMLFDENEETRLKAASIIIAGRRYQDRTPDDQRKFRVPKVNFSATSYTDMITWPSRPTEPPLLRFYSDEEIREIAMSRQQPSFFGLPCHTQAVERGVKIVTEASAAVCGEKSREGFIQSRLESRKTLPQIDTKKDFLLLFKS
ncbi:hypothetical protein FOCC_FOCC014702 [Frankliniella occidentalis]|nr:hypothetical protein FOCC_FOCC014702 [Frankliniella occidentalis]